MLVHQVIPFIYAKGKRMRHDMLVLTDCVRTSQFADRILNSEFSSFRTYRINFHNRAFIPITAIMHSTATFRTKMWIKITDLYLKPWTKLHPPSLIEVFEISYPNGSTTQCGYSCSRQATPTSSSATIRVRNFKKLRSKILVGRDWEAFSRVYKAQWVQDTTKGIFWK